MTGNLRKSRLTAKTRPFVHISIVPLKDRSEIGQGIAAWRGEKTLKSKWRIKRMFRSGGTEN